MGTISAVSFENGKLKLYRELCDQLEGLLGDEQNFVANAANTAALLFQMLPDVNWVGFYLAEDDSLVLGPFQGKPACSRIQIGKGVCGAAAERQETVIVANVREFEGHIECDPASASEIVVPLLNWGRLIGVLDIDSPSLNRFDDDDQEGLERLASLFLAKQRTDDLPSFNEEELMYS
ncbi:MAG TPA: GAF domain-containing protein [Bryobacteraceae bacterium]|jgi:GAF domain-containing protein|nr:GAF domain-containing protein [Bryobacteraceae bacterium]